MCPAVYKDLSIALFLREVNLYSLGLAPGTRGFRVVEELYVHLGVLVFDLHVFLQVRIVTHETWPPRESLQFRPRNVSHGILEL